MNYYPLSVINLIKNITRLPGIGEKTAERLAMHILSVPRAEAEELSKSILDAKTKTGFCSLCFALSDGEVCDICKNRSRDFSLICVVEQLADMVAIEKSGSFKGLYHILSGALSPISGIGPGDIRIKELISRVDKGEIKEVVVATNTNLEGEATASYLAELLGKFSVKVTRIASGVPMGGNLKFIDQVTLKRAMDTRHTIYE